jgi:hypothetical protein
VNYPNNRWSFASFYPEYLGLLVRPGIEHNPTRQPIGRSCRKVTRFLIQHTATLKTFAVYIAMQQF